MRLVRVLLMAATFTDKDFKEYMRIVNTSGIFDYTYVYHEEQLVARINPDGSKWYYHPDHLGSTTLITKGIGQGPGETTTYTPYGDILSGGEQEDYKLYTGQFNDETTGQNYYGARYYMPSWGRFISADPEIQDVYDPQYLNHYSYVRNNPYYLVDPTGRNARVYLNREAACNLGICPGHIAIGVDNPLSPGNEIIFENKGIGKNQIATSSGYMILDSSNTLGRNIMSFTGKYNAITLSYSKPTRNEEGDIILPNQYDDYYEIAQDPFADMAMIEQGQRQENNPWRYNARGHRSLNYANTILNADGQQLIGMNLLPVPFNYFPSSVFSVSRAIYTRSRSGNNNYYKTTGHYQGSDGRIWSYERHQEAP